MMKARGGVLCAMTYLLVIIMEQTLVKDAKVSSKEQFRKIYMKNTSVVEKMTAQWIESHEPNVHPAD